MKHYLWTGVAITTLLWSSTSLAKPVAPGIFCDTYPDAPVCQASLPDCSLCHTAAPNRNVFGDDVSAALAPGVPRPLSDQNFYDYLPDALLDVEALDSDGDGTNNYDEIYAGTLPGDPISFPGGGDCTNMNNPQYDVCGYDATYAFKKIVLDFCGFSPLYDDMQDFAALSDTDKMATLDVVLDLCLDSEFWIGKNGQLWQLAHPKVRPLGAFKAGEDEGAIPLADYYDDYHLFVYAQIDDHDVREVLTAQYYVNRADTDGTNPTSYTPVADKPSSQLVETTRRNGVLTTAWNLAYNVMFTALPRTAAAQAYRAFLGKDIAKMEGLNPVPNEPMDYDAKGVTNPACAVCHSTLDPLTYPFRNYNGLGGPPVQYVPDRLETLFPNEGPNIGNTPEAGVLLGQNVADLNEWTMVAANSDEFAQNVVRDYWQLTLGREPTADEIDEFNTLWQDLKSLHNYSVEAMLHDLIKTEAYGAP